VIAQKPSKDAQDYPPVARWDWDAEHHTHYISIRCGEEWCEVGRNDLKPSASHAGTVLPDQAIPDVGSPTSHERRRVLEIKGWYDEQRLAVPDGSGLLGASTITGTAFPHPMLDRLQAISDFDVKWIPAAYVLLDSESGPYKGKLNFDIGINRVYLCSGAFTNCSGVSSGASEPSCASEADHLWWARILSARGDVEYRCVIRRLQAGVEFPGTVRWRWDEHDEKFWIRCPQGCCTVN